MPSEAKAYFDYDDHNRPWPRYTFFSFGKKKYIYNHLSGDFGLFFIIFVLEKKKIMTILPAILGYVFIFGGKKKTRFPAILAITILSLAPHSRHGDKTPGLRLEYFFLRVRDGFKEGPPPSPINKNAEKCYLYRPNLVENIRTASTRAMIEVAPLFCFSKVPQIWELKTSPKN